MNLILDKPFFLDVKGHILNKSCFYAYELQKISSLQFKTSNHKEGCQVGCRASTRCGIKESGHALMTLYKD